MAKKIENVSLFVVREGNELQFASSEVQGGVRVAPVYLDGQRLDGVYSEVQMGSIDSMMPDASLSGRFAEVPAGVEARNAVLKKWSEAAKKASKAKKAGMSSLMLLSLAACGGGGGSAVEVKRGTLDATSDEVRITDASAGAIVTVADGANGAEATDTYVVAMDVDGAGELRIVFEDSDDVVVLSSATDISGFSTIIVEKGTVDFSAVTLSSDVEVIEVGSGVILTYDQFDGLSSIGLRDGATTGELTVIVNDLAEARLVDASTKVNAGINLDIDIAANADPLVLTIDELGELQGLVGADDELTYEIKDSAENLFEFNEHGVAIGIASEAQEAIASAKSVTIVDAKLSVNAALLEELRDLGVTFEGQVFNLERSAIAVAEGDSVTFILDTVNVAEGARYDYSIAGVSASDVDGSLSGTVIIGADGRAIVSVELAADRVTEGVETLSLSVAGQTQMVTVNDTSLSPTYTLTRSAENVDEGQAVVFTLETTNVDVGSTFDYAISGVQASDLAGGALTGTAVVGADGKAEIRVELAADLVTEGGETLSLSVAGQTQTVTVNDSSIDPDQQFTSAPDNLVGNDSFDNLFIGSVSSDYSVDGTASTFNPGDALDGAGGVNTLRLLLDEGAVADGVTVKNIQNLDLRLNADDSSDATEVVMTDWDDSLESISIHSNKSSLLVREQKTIADIAITDGSTDKVASNYEFQYAAGVLDSDNDELDLSVNNVNGSDGAEVAVDAGIEAINVDVKDSAGTVADVDRYASNIDLSAAGVSDVDVTGGRSGQQFTLNASVADDADFDSTQFAGDMDLTSGNIKTARFGDGDDTAVFTGEADDPSSNYNFGEGDNTATFNVTLRGDVTAGEGSDAVTVSGPVTAGSSVNLNGGNNEFTTTGRLDGTFTSGSGRDTVEVQSTGVGASYRSSINVGDGENTVTVTGAHAGDITGGSDGDTVTADSTAAGSTIDVGNGTNSVTVDNVHAGSITGGSDSDTVNALSTAASSSIDLGDGTNTVALITTHAGSIEGGNDSDTVTASATLAGSTITLGDGQNFVTLTNDHAGSITGGVNTDVIDVASVTAGAIDTDDGTDEVYVDGDVTNASIDMGDGNQNLLQVTGSISRNTPPTSITFGDGNENVLYVGGSITNEAVSFGTGSNNLAIIDREGLFGSSIEFGGDSNGVFIGGDVTESDITFGNGENYGQVDGSVSAGSNITFGDGSDDLVIGDFTTASPLVFSSAGEDLPVFASAFGAPDFTEDTATIITMGDGDDLVALVSAGTEGGYSDDIFVVESGGFIDGGNGTDDTFVVATQQDDDTDVIGRTEHQKVEIELYKPDVSSYRPGDEITISFGGEIDPVTYTVLASDIVQGDGVLTSQNIAVGVAAALTNNVPFQDVFGATAIDGTANTGGAETTSVYIISDVPLDDVTITASHGIYDEGAEDVTSTNPVEVTVMQISDTRVTGFENAALVIVDKQFSISGNDFNEPDGVEPTDFLDVPTPEALASTTMRADFDLIELEGSKTVILDSQVRLDSTIETFVNGINDTLNLGAYTKNYTNGAQTFDLDNLQGGEAISVGGYETTTSGNLQVNRINVDPRESAHNIGDQITVTIGETVMVYTIVAEDLSQGIDNEVDADRIALKLKGMINAKTEEHGFTAVRDVFDEVESVTDGSPVTYFGPSADNFGQYVDGGPIGSWVTITGPENVSAAFDVSHTRPAVITTDDSLAIAGDLTAADQSEWNILTALEDLLPDDVITVTLGGVMAEYTVTAEDCLRLNADMIGKELASQLGGDAVYRWGTIDFGGNADLLVTRNIAPSAGSETGLSGSSNPLQDMAATDDGVTDVLIQANLAAGADTTMDLTVDGYGEFDVEIAGNSGADGYTDLEMSIVDEFDHTIDLNGGISIQLPDTSIQGNFSNKVMVDGGVEGQNIVLSEVLSREVDTSTSAANYEINQYDTVRDADPARYTGEAITVTTGTGDDHLTTLAPSAMASDSSIDLDVGANRLSLGWGTSVIIGSSDLGAIGGIDYQGDLTQLDILNDVVLSAAGPVTAFPAVGLGSTTALTMPGGVADVEMLTFTNLLGEDADLTVVGAAEDFDIVSGGDFDLLDEFVAAGTLTVQDAFGGEITGDLSVTGGSLGDVKFNIGNNVLTSLDVSAGSDADVYLAGNSDSDAENVDFTIGSVSVEAGNVVSGAADFTMAGNTNTGAQLGLTGGIMVAGTTASVAIANNDQLSAELGAVTVEAVDAAQLSVEDTNGSSVSIDGVDMTAGTSATVAFGSNDMSDITVTGDLSLVADLEARLNVLGNEMTNVSVAVDSDASDADVSLTSCASDAEVLVDGNVNNHDPFNPDPLADGFIQDFVIEFGDVALDAGEDASLRIVDNVDDTFYGNLTVDVGNVDMLAYSDAEIVVGFDDFGFGEDGNVATTVDIDDVDMLAQNNASITVDDNTGKVYTNSLASPPRLEIDYANISFGSVTMAADLSDASVDITDNRLAVISMASATLDAGRGVIFNIANNDTVDGDYNYTVSDAPTPVDVDIQIGQVTMTGGDEAVFSIADNDASASDSEINITVDGVAMTSGAGSDALIEIVANDASNGAELTIVVDGVPGMVPPLMAGVTASDADVSIVSGSDASVGISGNFASDGADLNITVGDAFIDADRNAEILVSSNVALGFATTADITVGSITATGSNAFLSVFNNDALFNADLGVALGGVSLTGDDGNVDFQIADNDAFSDASVSISVAMGEDQEVELDASDDVFFSISDNSADTFINSSVDESSVTVSVGDVGISAGSDADFEIFLNVASATGSDADATFSTSVGDVTIGTSDVGGQIGGTAGFDIIANSAFADGGDAETSVSVGNVSMVALDRASFAITDNDAAGASFGSDDANATVNVTVLDVGIVSGSDVDFTIISNDAVGSDADVFVTTGSVTIDAGDDVVFTVDGAGSTTTTLGAAVTITSGLDVNSLSVGDTVTDISSLVDVVMNQVSGADVVTITAKSRDGSDGGTASGNVFGFFDDTIGMNSVTVSGTNAELYFFDLMGADADGDFTLDLSGMTGSFGAGGAANYDPDGIAGVAVDIDDGTYVVNEDAEFADTVFIRIGTGDLIYNAQSSDFGPAGSDDADWYISGVAFDNDDNDWFTQEGWYSLGDGLDLDPVQQVQVLTFSAFNDAEDEESAVFDVQVGDVTYAITVLTSGASGDNDEGNFQGSGSLGSTGITYQVTGSYGDEPGDTGNGVGTVTVTFTGPADGSSFTLSGITDFTGQFAGELFSNNITTPGELANDGQGNDASEVFQFVSDDIGEVVIGGFNANAILNSSSGIDYLDFSAYSAVNELSDLNFYTDETLVGAGDDGYFNDVIITSDAFDGSIRLVGLAENENWQTSLESSILFNQSELP